MSLVSMLAELKVNTYFIGTVYCRYYISKEVLLIRIHPCSYCISVTKILNICSIANHSLFLKLVSVEMFPIRSFDLNSILHILSQTGTFGGNNNFVSFSLILLG